MARIFDKKAEIDLIRSMYIEGEELNFHDADLVKRFYSLFEIIDEPEDVGIGFSLKLMNMIELSIFLPVGYPSATDAYPSKPRITIRGLSSALINIRSLSHEFEKWLEQSDAKGAPILLSVIEWMSENLANHLVSEPSECLVPTPNCTPSPDSLFVCLFIHSHHIVNHVKRQNILRWAKELNLCGGLMPGWPGIIVAEGTKIDADEFWRRVHSLRWKRIQLKHYETYSACTERKSLRFTPEAFCELALDNASRVNWILSHGVPHEIVEHLLGVPVKRT